MTEKSDSFLFLQLSIVSEQNLFRRATCALLHNAGGMQESRRLVWCMHLKS